MTSDLEHRSWLDETISELVLDAEENYLEDFGGQAIFDAPLIGVADGRDGIFDALKTAVDPRHLNPVDFLHRNATAQDSLDIVRVVVWVLPFTKNIRLSNHGSEWPSRLYSLARNNGGALNHVIRVRLADKLRERGWAAAAPVMSEEYNAFRSPEYTFASTWSERHVAFAAGLGQFGLSASFITAVGSNVRIGSIVTNLPVEPTPRTYDDHRAPCLADGGAQCGRCIKRCPVAAISSNGMNKNKCNEMRMAVKERFTAAYTRDMKMIAAPIVASGRRADGYSLGCALCQCGVPCEATMPHQPVNELTTST